MRSSPTEHQATRIYQEFVDKLFTYIAIPYCLDTCIDGNHRLTVKKLKKKTQIILDSM